jgi:hypothetical protein
MKTTSFGKALLRLSAVALATTALEAAAANDARDASDQQPIVGTFAGRFVDGSAVYRLPPVTVIGTRKLEPATTIEDRSARAKPQARGARSRQPA